MSVAKTIGRRLFARAAVGVPTALAVGGGGHGHLPSMISAPPPIGVAGGMNAAKSSTSFAMMEKVWGLFNKESKADREMYDRRSQRRAMMGGLDADLAVLNSMSLQRRVQIQMDREKAFHDHATGLRAKIIRRLGGNPEDFE